MVIKVVNLYKNKYDVYIGRPGKGQRGTFGNPVAIGRLCPVCGSVHKDGGSTLPCYEKDLDRRLRDDVRFRSSFMGLVEEAIEAEKAGRILALGCFCKPRRCHGDVLAAKVLQVMRHIQGRG